MTIQVQKACEVIEGSNYTAVKYPDGRSEYIAKYAVTNLNVNSPAGLAFYGILTLGSFPDGLFVEKPEVNATFVADDSNGAIIYGLRYVSNTNVGNVPLVRLEQGVLNGYLSLSAKGRWK